VIQIEAGHLHKIMSCQLRAKVMDPSSHNSLISNIEYAQISPLAEVMARFALMGKIVSGRYDEVEHLT
jgi:hypothetical protein